jgi:beta-1,4-N-acetylglucosaminyltransferase
MKVCLVTVGATASFEKLVRQVLSESFLASLKQHNYSHLLVQYGKDGKPIMDEFLEKNPEGSASLHDIGIGGFDFTPSMTPLIMMLVHDPAKDQEQGLMISHAGETLRFHLCGVESRY